MSDDDHEARFWGKCLNTYGEETKQLVYLEQMGFKRIPNNWRTDYSFDGEGKSYIDIGGGPCSVLLKFEYVGRRTIIDPGIWPTWAVLRYHEAGILIFRTKAEDIIVFGPEETKPKDFNVGLLYNVLQHVDDPAKVIRKARAVADELRVFEWIDIPPHEGHPHCLTAAFLDDATGRKGRVEEFYGARGCRGKAWILGAPT